MLTNVRSFCGKISSQGKIPSSCWLVEQSLKKEEKTMETKKKEWNTRREKQCSKLEQHDLLRRIRWA
jgi:hypothetical protein